MKGMNSTVRLIMQLITMAQVGFSQGKGLGQFLKNLGQNPPKKNLLTR